MKRDNDIIFKGFSLFLTLVNNTGQMADQGARECSQVFPDVILLHDALSEPSTVSSIPDPDSPLSNMWSLQCLERKDPVCG